MPRQSRQERGRHSRVLQVSLRRCPSLLPPSCSTRELADSIGLMERSGRSAAPSAARPPAATSLPPNASFRARRTRAIVSFGSTACVRASSLSLTSGRVLTPIARAGPPRSCLRQQGEDPAVGLCARLTYTSPLTPPQMQLVLRPPPPFSPYTPILAAVHRSSRAH